MYTNPRLKHVKKIREVIADMPIYWQGYTDLILDQCNLLLETKKKKKCLHEHLCCPGGIKTVRCAYCGKSMYKEPSPQPDKGFTSKDLFKDVDKSIEDKTNPYMNEQSEIE